MPLSSRDGHYNEPDHTLVAGQVLLPWGNVRWATVRGHGLSLHRLRSYPSRIRLVMQYMFALNNWQWCKWRCVLLASSVVSNI